ncbi:hypothetical protein F444_16885 [Phytophthora nicotianae P1976]|uniref:Uncharacterized protein n=2 Tax=Phytophthora nicotianae TaxID=4792 RepID=A0A080ZGT8_PHYNI|nr:hypothetical protein F444_16885 [Phytophthora nicotianae P1976]
MRGWQDSTSQSGACREHPGHQGAIGYRRKRDGGDNDGNTALHIAISRTAKPKTIHLLLDKDGKTALHLATLLKNIPITKALLDKGASVTAVDQNLQTPLHLAVYLATTIMMLKHETRIDTHDTESGLETSQNAQTYDDEDDAIAHLLCSQGYEAKVQTSSQRSSLTKIQLGLLVTTEYWHKCFLEGKPLMLVPSEVIKGGGATVDTYLNAMNETADGQLVKRCKISGVGPSTWGKLHLSRHCRR